MCVVCIVYRAGTHGLLDVARTSYLQSVEDIHQAARQYSEQLGVPVKALFGASRGYYLQLPNTVPSLPEKFIQGVLNRTSISCTTEEVLCLSDRAQESILAALTITNEVIQELLGSVRLHMGDLFSLTDSVALLDMLGSFADMVACSPLVFTRPHVKEAEDGPLLIDGGRHPVMSSLQPLHFVENGVFLNSVQSFQVVSGVNGAGKSTFIKQTALIVILAQVGCYVPARHAVVPIRDKIFSRVSE
jgi:DNA mismatch repair protein MSH4